MASGEQANGIDEMSQAVAHLDEMTQQNAALAEQSAASAGSLNERIGQLNRLVDQFKTTRRADVNIPQKVTVKASHGQPLSYGTKTAA